MKSGRARNKGSPKQPILLSDKQYHSYDSRQTTSQKLIKIYQICALFMGIMQIISSQCVRFKTVW